MSGISSRNGLADKQQLKTWLAPSAQSFVLALLSDLYTNDADVRAWLAQRRPEFQGQTAADLLRMGRADEVETLLVQLWNAPTKAQLRRPTHLRRNPA